MTYKTVLTLKPKEGLKSGWSNYAVLGILNSTLCSWIAGHIANKKEKKAFPRISLFDLKRLPLPASPDPQIVIADRVPSSITVITQPPSGSVAVESLDGEDTATDGGTPV